jgi:hypothetical protein
VAQRASPLQVSIEAPCWGCQAPCALAALTLDGPRAVVCLYATTPWCRRRSGERRRSAAMPVGALSCALHTCSCLRIAASTGPHSAPAHTPRPRPATPRAASMPSRRIAAHLRRRHTRRWSRTRPRAPPASPYSLARSPRRPRPPVRGLREPCKVHLASLPASTPHQRMGGPRLSLAR